MQGSTPQSEDGTVLPFPDRFHAASEFVLNPPAGSLSSPQAVMCSKSRPKTNLRQEIKAKARIDASASSQHCQGFIRRKTIIKAEMQVSFILQEQRHLMMRLSSYCML